MGKPDGSGTADSFAMWIGNGNLQAEVANTSQAVVIGVPIPSSAKLNTWYQWTLTYDAPSRVLILYIDGTAVAGTTGAGRIYHRI